MSMLPRIRLRQVLFFTFTLIASVPVIILAVWEQQSALDKEIAAVEEKHLLVAHNLTGDLARYIIDVESSLKLVATNLLNGNELTGVSEHLDSLYLRYVYLSSKTGVIAQQAVGASQVSLAQVPASIFTYLSPILQQARLDPGKVLYSDMVRTGVKQTTFYLVMAVRNEQFVIAALSTTHIIDVQKKVTFGRRGHAAIVDRTGRAIAHPIPGWVESMKDMSFLPPVKAMMQGHTGVSQFFTPAMKADMVAGYTVVPRAGWGVMIPQPFEELEERASEVQIAALTIALLGMTIAGFISWYIAGILSHPIQSVVDATRLNASNKEESLNVTEPLVARVSTSRRFIPHELDELLSSFNLMRENINKLNNKLHSKINYANDEVKAQNIQLQKYSVKLLSTNEKLGDEIVERRKAEEESALLSTRLRSLYNETQLKDLSYSERILSALSLGCKFFDLDIGRVCEINEKNNTNTIKYIISPDDYNVPPGTASSLEDTFCKIPYESEDAFYINNISESQLSQENFYKRSSFEAYLATVIWVNGEKYGTITFSSKTPKKSGFTDSDVDFLKIISQWVGISMERRISDEKDTARTAAEAANYAKGTFLANMSHELRTPINAILGYGEILLEDCEESGNEYMKQDLEKIHIAGTHLKKLISNILDLSKIEAGKIDVFFENIDIESLIGQITDTMRPLNTRNNNQLITSIEKNIGHMFSDSTITQQILLNLLGNATKFTVNGEIEIAVSIQQVDDIECVEFKISDSGSGISTEKLGIIFDEFSQANTASSSKYGGIGLGLSISKKYCALLKGSITATSKLNEGSSFIVTLPRNSENVNTTASSA